MHIAEGILSPLVIATGATITTLGCAWGLHRAAPEAVVRMGMLAAAFFAFSLLHVPIAGTSVHLMGLGLMGLILGRGVWPAVVVALVIQALFLGYGGLTSLGVTATVIALPAVISGWVMRRAGRHQMLISGIAGFAAVQLALGLLALALWASGAGLIAWIFVLAHQPVALLEGLLSAGAVQYLRRCQSPLLHTHPTSQPTRS